jgi:hypothetical protein
MKIVYENNWFARLVLAKGFGAFMFFGLVLAKGTVNERTRRHETIHVYQWIEVTCLSLLAMLGVGAFTGAWWTAALAPVVFYVIYMINWLVLIFIPSIKNAYRAICFEREAYAKENVIRYLDGRPLFSWAKYIFKS